MIAKENTLFIRSLIGINSILKSDHLLNLFEDVNGVLPEDKSKMIDIIEKFLKMNCEK